MKPKYFRFYGGEYSQGAYEYDSKIIPELVRKFDFEESEYIRIIFEDNSFVQIK